MTRFVENPVDFAADCVRQDGKCAVVRENFLFIDNGNELLAVDKLLRKCGHVVIIPDGTGESQSILYHTSCQRMSDALNQIFPNALGNPTGLPHASQEMSVGEFFCRKVAMPYERCRKTVDSFGSWDVPGT